MTKLQDTIGGYATGVHLGISNEDYHADCAVSSTGIKRLLESPLAFWWYSKMNPNRSTDEGTVATKLGTAYHTLILEPHKFAADFKILYGQKSTTKDGCLGEGEYTELLAMKDALHRKPMQMQTLVGGYAEASIFWVDDATGVKCRCRYDYWKAGYITDLKTSKDISDKGFYWSFADLGYDVSAAMYMEGARKLKEAINDGTAYIDSGIDLAFIRYFLAEETERFGFLMQEKSAPYDSRYRVVSPFIQEVGYQKFRKGLEIYAENEAKYGTDAWPSGYEEIELITDDQVTDRINFF